MWIVTDRLIAWAFDLADTSDLVSRPLSWQSSSVLDSWLGKLGLALTLEVGLEDVLALSALAQTIHDL